MTPRATIVVTGGTGALGVTVIDALLSSGAAVGVPYRSESGWSALRQRHGIERLWGRVTDLTDPADMVSFADEAADRLGPLTGLAALAGAYASAPSLERAPDEQWDEMMRDNLTTAHQACRAALPHLLNACGSVVMVGSRLVESGGPGSAAYTVSKAAVIALTRALASENQRRGVRFNCVLPSIIDTPANRRAMPKADPATWTRPEAIAGVIAYLLSPASAPLTGALLPV